MTDYVRALVTTLVPLATFLQCIAIVIYSYSVTYLLIYLLSPTFSKSMISPRFMHVYCKY